MDKETIQNQESVEDAGDEEIVSALIKHIVGPCESVVNGKVFNIRDFYLGQARELLDPANKKRVKDPEQIKRLRQIIQIAEPS
ncbi:MAG: hypothetical protein PHV42_00945 [Candidatus Pacebacteria bacterium]|nr:hypothetical protein [Candidatus Paceibacterota bacterium]